MFNKLSGVLVLAMLALGLFPTVASAVDANGSLSVASPLVPGAAQSFTVSVTNPSTGGIFGVGGSAGADITLVEIVKTSNLKNLTCGDVAPAGWVCDVDRDRSILLYGDTLAPGDTLTVPFTADVNSNFDRDRTSSLQVYTQEEDSYNLVQVAGDFSFSVASLEIAAGSLDVTDPAGVADLSGTEGQTITVSYDVNSLAQADIPVTAELLAGGAVVATDDITVLSGAVPTTATFTYTLPSAGGSQAVAVNFSARVANEQVSAIGDTTLTVSSQHVQKLALDATTFSNAVLNGEGTTVSFAINTDLSFLPSIDNLTGSLSFAGNTATLENTALDAGLDDIPLLFAPTNITAVDGTYDVDFTFAGTDDNGVAWSDDYTLEDLIEIDNKIPVVTVDLAGPTGQDQVRDGNVINVTGTVDDGFVTTVELVDNDNNTYPVPVAQAGQDFSGSVTLATGMDYTQIYVTAEAIDDADNPGYGESDTDNKLDVDNVEPVVDTEARIVAGSLYGESDNLIEVTIHDNFAVRGGCDSGHWTVDNGYQVTDVKFSDGTDCQEGQAGPDNTRYLVVDNLTTGQLDQDALYNVNYSPTTQLGVSSDRLRDGAINDAPAEAMETVSGIAPDVPNLTTLRRNGDTEDTVFAEGTYWTRFDGADAIATISNTRAGYMIQVLNENGEQVAITGADGPNGTVAIPIDITEGTYNRTIRLINGAGLISEGFPLSLTLDLTAPEIDSASVAINTAGIDTVTVSFTEVLYAGANRAIDWTVYQNNDFPGQGDEEFHNFRANSVDGNGNSRVLNVNLDDDGTYAFTEYFFKSQITEGSRYEDYAGNLLANDDDYTPPTP